MDRTAENAASTGDQVCSAQEELGSCWKERSEKSDKWESTDTDGPTQTEERMLSRISWESSLFLQQSHSLSHLNIAVDPSLSVGLASSSQKNKSRCYAFFTRLSFFSFDFLCFLCLYSASECDALDSSRSVTANFAKRLTVPMLIIFKCACAQSKFTCCGAPSSKMTCYIQSSFHLRRSLLEWRHFPTFPSTYHRLFPSVLVFRHFGIEGDAFSDATLVPYTKTWLVRGIIRTKETLMFSQLSHK